VADGKRKRTLNFGNNNAGQKEIIDFKNGCLESIFGRSGKLLDGIGFKYSAFDVRDKIS